MILLLTLLVFAVAFSVFGGLVGYVAGYSRGRAEMVDDTAPRTDVNLATGGYNPLWVKDAPEVTR